MASRYKFLRWVAFMNEQRSQALTNAVQELSKNSIHHAFFRTLAKEIKKYQLTDEDVVRLIVNLCESKPELMDNQPHDEPLKNLLLDICYKHHYKSAVMPEVKSRLGQGGR